MAAPDPRRAPAPAGRVAAKRHRLSGPGAFAAVFERGHRSEGRYVQLVYVPVNDDSGSAGGRFGFVVSRKAMRRAVDRNRFKRIVRERLRLLRDDAVRYDLVIRVKRPVVADAVDAAAMEAVTLIERFLAQAPSR